METRKLVLLVLCLFMSPLCSQSSSPTTDQQNGSINWWCSSTPHPETCRHFMGSHPNLFRPNCRDEFRTMTVQVALEQVHTVKRRVKSLRHRCRSNKKKKAVWGDCNKLLSNSMLQLNRTIQGFGSNKTTAFDAQTWLSTALTNLEVCRTGSSELNVTNFVSPLVSKNVTQLISNSLAVNGATLQQQDDYVEGFPSWVTASERKLLKTASSTIKADAVVALDGSGQFQSIQAAINSATSNRKGNGRVVVYVKRGVYNEVIEIDISMNKVTLIGDGIKYTIITGSRSVAGGYTTYSCATLGVDGIGFMARGITFRNTAGPQNAQAVALRSASDLSVLYNCGFEGYQDTLFVQAQRQFFRNCAVSGTIDFIFGNAAVVFQNCKIYVRKPLWGQVNVITAQGRADPFQNTGISIHDSRVLPAADLKNVVASYNSYLGRPWMQYSRTVFMKTYFDSFINPAGWLPWENTDFALDTLYYGEYQNYGPGSSTRYRVNWKGYHVITSSAEASRFTVANFIAGPAWLPSTGVPFVAGL